MAERYRRLGLRDLRSASKPVDPFSDKRARGRALIIGGSSRYHGAPVLASTSAYNLLASLRVGAGYSKLYVPRSILNPVRSLSPNTIVGALGRNNITCNMEILHEIEMADAVAIGMGIGKTGSAMSASAKIIGHAIDCRKTVVVDADAIRSLPRFAKGHALDRCVIATPHDAEFYAMTGMRLPERDLSYRASISAEYARRLNIIIVLKGHRTVVTDGDTTMVNISKSHALATMGTGDVLSGIICGYAAAGATPIEAAAAGVYLHSRIGDMLSKINGDHIIAKDVVDAIPECIRAFDRVRDKDTI
jgi:NAD(P)H-hydrate epimerase